MNRLDEIEHVVMLAAMKDTLYLPRDEVRQLVAVARIANEFKDAIDDYDENYTRLVDARRALSAALAPLLASTEPMVVATARDNAGNAATVVAPLLAEKEGDK